MSQLSKQDVNYRIGAEFNYANNCIRVIEKYSWMPEFQNMSSNFHQPASVF